MPRQETCVIFLHKCGKTSDLAPEVCELAALEDFDQTPEERCGRVVVESPAPALVQNQTP